MIIRFAELRDAQQILDIYKPYVENTTISFEAIAPTKEEMETRIRNVLQQNPWLVLEDRDEILGYAYASKHRERAAYRWSIDVSVYVKEVCHRRGAGKALYTALFIILKYQGYYNAYAGICLPNEKSVGLHEYFGFRKIAQYNKVGYKLGRWHDVGWWEMFLQQHAIEPKEPLAISDIEQTILDGAFERGIQEINKYYAGTVEKSWINYRLE